MGPARLTPRQTAMDDAIYKKETEYLEDTPYGNILIGFDNYIKGSSSAAPGGGRRKAGVDDTNRVFSRSSVRYNDITVGVSLGIFSFLM
jgi:chromatin modification-related protein EAF6